MEFLVVICVFFGASAIAFVTTIIWFWVIDQRCEAEWLERKRLEAEWWRKYEVQRAVIMASTPRLASETEGNWLHRVNAKFWSNYTGFVR